MNRLPRFAKGKFIPKNKEKYVGTKMPTYRSSWEQAFMRLCDEHPNVINGQVKVLRFHIDILCQENTLYTFQIFL